MKRTMFLCFLGATFFVFFAGASNTKGDVIPISYAAYRETMWRVVAREQCLQELVATKDTTRVELIYLLHKFHVDQHTLSSFCDKDQDARPVSLKNILERLGEFSYFLNLPQAVSEEMYRISPSYDSAVDSMKMPEKQSNRHSAWIAGMNREAKFLDTTMAQMGTTGYIRLHSLRKQRAVQWVFWKLFRGFESNHTEVIILDLRDNEGGFIDEALNLAGIFLGDGVIFQKFIPAQRNIVVDVRASDATTPLAGNMWSHSIPLIILIDEYTLSAAEMVAGAIKTHNRGILIGRRTHGKGTIQQNVLLHDGTWLHLTIGRWFLPDGTIVHEKGIEPNIHCAKEEGQVDSCLLKAIDVAQRLRQ